MRIRSASFIISLFLAVALTGGGIVANTELQPAYAAAYAGPAQGAKYKIYCVNGRIEIDSHTLGDMKSSRGSNVCALSPDEYDTLSDARTSARRFGGVGAPCRCPK
jgi:hypothetical protein